MSQHTYSSPSGQVLIAGFDRICGEFFFSVFQNAQADGPISTSILEQSLDVYSIEAVKQQALIGVPDAPKSMWESIRQDAMNNVGNRCVQWNPDGTIKFDSASHVHMEVLQ